MTIHLRIYYDSYLLSLYHRFYCYYYYCLFNVPIIWEMLIKLPLLPEIAIVKGLLPGGSSFKQTLPP